ncbi:hypothetical protein BTR22_13300 [Alkalihalophilus pseudofirmus]|uniref:hypothetical protein n=1 Tax=Alkalihalophilus pseudofirmus TaxID=79885 RepID=UPI000952D091|nr:hypothetical protein BTR22_13300 [Alkalihalophilus pseudofirmus]
MQVNHLQQIQNQQPERAIPLREGDVYKATVKERKDHNEALISIRGREVLARFEGGVPSGERVTIQVDQVKEAHINVRAVNEEPRAATQASNQNRDTLNQTLQNLGSKNPTPAMREAAQALMDKGVPLTREGVAELDRFLRSGDAANRLETVKALANKRLEVTSTHLRSVHEALHGRPYTHVLNDLAKEVDPEFKVDPRERMSDGRQELPARNGEPLGSNQNGRMSPDYLREIRQMIQLDASIERAVQTARSQVVQHPETSREAAQLVERSTTEAAHLTKVAQERVQEAVSQVLRQSSGIYSQINRELQAISQAGGSIEDTVEMIRTARSSQELSAAHQQLVDKAVAQAAQLIQAGREQMIQALTKSEELIQSNLNGTSNLNSIQSNSLGSALMDAGKALQQEPNIQRVIQMIETSLLNHPEIPRETQKQLGEALMKAADSTNNGREMRARQFLSQALLEVESLKAGVDSNQFSPNQTGSIQSGASLLGADQYIQNEFYQTSLEAASKNIAVTTVTEKLAEAAQTFKQFQREVSRTLDQIMRQTEQFKQHAEPSTKPLLESTIKKLDHAILRSEMMLLTDMKTERSLMQASSQLQEAKKLLSKGLHEQANQIVKEVKQLVERLNFQPSETKVKHYVALNERAGQEGRTPSQILSQQYSEHARSPIQEGSPRAMFEMIRGMGLNRDSEIAQQLAAAKEHTEINERNVKATLMQIARGEEEGTRLNQLANQALNNMTGQQLLSRSDQQANMQSLFFNLPMLLQNKVENLQVFVNSRNEGEKVDWENCSLFFLMETPKMGEVGISLSAADRQLSVTLKNDGEAFEEKMAPLVDQAVEKLSAIGYSIKGIQYSKLKQDEQDPALDQVQKKVQTPTFTEKGFDFKI